MCIRDSGHILARGSEREIIDASGLTVWAIQGPELATIVEPLKAAPGVLSVAAFGNAVHVAGQNAAQVQQALDRVLAGTGLQAQPGVANLEDVFISLIATAPDNYAQKPTQEAAA